MTVTSRGLARPDETRAFDGGQVQVVKIGSVQPGHDAWVVGDDAETSVEFSGSESYAKKG